MTAFDVYHKWLGIPPRDQPPNHYRLLAVEVFESDLDVIASAADQRMAHVRSFQTGQNSALSQQLLNELAAARVCLLNPEKKAAYDEQLRRQQATPAVRRAPAAAASALPPRRRKKSVDKTWLVFGCLAVVVAVLIGVLAATREPADESPVAVKPAASSARAASNPTSVPASDAEKPATKPAPEPKAAVEPPKLEEPVAPVEPKPAQPTLADLVQSPGTENKGPEAKEPAVKTPDEAGPAGQEPAARPAMPPPGKLPVPEPAAQQKAQATIREVYEADYKSAETRATLVSKLLKSARDTRDDPASRFALLVEARDLAAETGQTDLAFEAVDALAADYQLSAARAKAEMLEKAAKTVKLIPQKQALAEIALRVIDDALAEDDFDTARQVGRLASQLVRLSKEAELMRNVAAKNKEVEAAAKAFASVESALAALKADPADPAANLAVGRYYCFNKNDWEKGLPLLAKGSDAALRDLAQRDLKGPAATDEQVKLGDAWWDAGGKPRAVYWYEHALPMLAGLQKERVSKRIDELGPKPAASKWVVLFRSANPKIWNTSFKSGKELAVPAANAPPRIKYLKLSCEHGQVIVPATNDDLTRTFAQAHASNEQVGWFGDNVHSFGGHHMGIFNRAWKPFERGAVILGANRNRDAGDGQQGNQGGGDRRDRGDPGGGDRNPGGRGPFGGRGLFGGFEFFSGWGFGNIVFDDSRQGYCWAGKAVAATTFEIAVKTGELTKEETKLLVR